MFDTEKFLFRILDVFKMTLEEGSLSTPPRPFQQLSLRLKGDVDFTAADGNIFHAEKNSLLYIPKDFSYTRKSNVAEELIVVHFEIVGDAPSKMNIFTPQNQDVFTDLFNRLYEIWYKKSIGYEYLADATFLKILANVKKQKLQQSYSLQEHFVSLLDFIHSNFADPDLTVEKMARHINVSSTYLRKIFLSQLKISPLDYLIDIRLNHATSLLKSGYYSVEQIAQLCGFNSPKYFSTCYKHKRGISPIKVKTAALHSSS